MISTVRHDITSGNW